MKCAEQRQFFPAVIFRCTDELRDVATPQVFREGLKEVTQTAQFCEVEGINRFPPRHHLNVMPIH